MNKVIIINLNGNAYQLEESGYDALRAYLDTAGRRLEGNPDRDEIIADIEQAIADKFRALLGANKSVVVGKEVESVIAEMGNVEDASGGAASAQPGSQQAPKPEQPRAEAQGSPKRLYKIHEGAMIAGVCNGIAAYTNIDVTIIRILFAILALTYGSGVLLYLLMALLLPAANTSTEKAAAYGAPSTSQEFIRRAREGYYEGMKTFKDKRAHREWKRRFKAEMRGWRQDFSREFHQNTNQWAQNWRQHWATHPHPGFGSWILIPILTILCFVVWFSAIVAVVSFLSNGTVFGMPFFSGIPAWLGIVFIIFFFSLITWPIKMMRRSLYWGYGPGYPGPVPHVLNGLVWVAVVALMIWIAQRHSFHLREAVNDLPHEVHRAVDSVRDWWDRQ
jgi:phage shock protein PspC (stress-responsive transcriptional regulator)